MSLAEDLKELRNALNDCHFLATASSYDITERLEAVLNSKTFWDNLIAAIEQEQSSDNAAMDALNDVATLCGCPDWEYPGQVVRDVELLKDSVEELKTKLQHTEGTATIAIEWMRNLNGSINDLVVDLNKRRLYGP
jgi:hypothetical protein